MIYLIGGPPRCGKTTLARQLARIVQSPWLQTDHGPCVQPVVLAV